MMKRLNKHCALFFKGMGCIAALLFICIMFIIVYNANSVNIYNPDYADGFYYNKLDEEQKASYTVIYKGLTKYKNSIKIDHISEASIKTVFYSIIFDNPELIFVSDKFSYEKDKNGNVVCFCPSYTMGKKEISKQILKINERLEEIKEKTADMTEYEKELYVHDYLLKQCKYETGKPENSTIYGAIVVGKANCRGYSSAFAYILNKLGIKASQIIGTAEKDGIEEGHSWNIVLLGNEYYYCDVCWNDINDEDVYEKIPYHYSFFNMNYEDISKTHKQDIQEEYLFPINNTNNGVYSYMKKNGLYASNYEEACDIIMTKLPFAKNLGKPLMVQCKSDLDYLNFEQNIEKIITEASKRNELDIVCCKYFTVQNGNTIIIYNVY